MSWTPLTTEGGAGALEIDLECLDPARPLATLRIEDYEESEICISPAELREAADLIEAAVKGPSVHDVVEEALDSAGFEEPEFGTEPLISNVPVFDHFDPILFPLTESGKRTAEGNQSDLPTRFEILPAQAVATVARIMAEGAEKYGEQSWRGISVESNLSHALRHAYRALESRRTDDVPSRDIIEELGSVATRALFALEVAIQEAQA